MVKFKLNKYNDISTKNKQQITFLLNVICPSNKPFLGSQINVAFYFTLEAQLKFNEPPWRLAEPS